MIIDKYPCNGTGPAGLVCAETLRAEGYDGQITVVCKEQHLPYDRSKLSKVSKVTDYVSCYLTLK